MQTKKPNSSEIGMIVNSRQKKQKYQILQKINKVKSKSTTQQLNKSTFFKHTDTFIVKKQSNKMYFIMKRYQILSNSGLYQIEKSYSKSPYLNNNKINQSFDVILEEIVKQLNAKVLFHPNLLSIQDVFFSKNQLAGQQTGQQQKLLINFFIVEQYCQQGDLAYFIKRQNKKLLNKQIKNKSPSAISNKISNSLKKNFQQKLVARWLLQILLALQILHFHKLTHQDLKLQNIYLTPSGTLKLNENYLLNMLNTIFYAFQTNKQSPLNNAGSNNSSTKKQVYPNPSKQSNQYQFLQGYEPMLNQKKFKLNQKKDILDFGLIIASICNFQKFQSPKKQQTKNAKFSPTHSNYSSELIKICQDSINNKKICILVGDILKTQYFLETMREFIILKKLNVQSIERIPIKKYTIHKKSKKQIQQAALQSNDNNNNLQKQKQKQPKRLPKIQRPNIQSQKNQKLSTNNTSLPKKNTPKQKLENLAKQKQGSKTQQQQKLIIKKSLQTLKRKLQKSKQKLSSRQSKSRQKIDRKHSSSAKFTQVNPSLRYEEQSSNLNGRQKNKEKPKILTPISNTKKNPLLPPPPSLQKQQNTISKSVMETPNEYETIQNTKSKIQNKRSVFDSQKVKQTIELQKQNMQAQTILQGKDQAKFPKEFNLIPQITFGKKTNQIPTHYTQQTRQQTQIQKNEDKIQIQPYPGGGSNKNQQESAQKRSYMSQREIQLQKISQNLAKIFSDLKIRQDDEQELSFQLNDQTQQQDGQLRLTLKLQKQLINSQQGKNNLMKTYKSKFDQMIAELQEKYQPNMETIMQKTYEWDSNDFSVNRQLLKRLRLDEGQSLLPHSSENFQQSKQNNDIKRNFQKDKKLFE